MCQPEFSLKNDNSEILNSSSENVTTPLPFDPEETHNFAEEDEVEVPATFEIYIELPDIQERYVDDNIETVQNDEVNLSLNDDGALSHYHHHHGNTSLENHAINHSYAHLSRPRRRNRRGRFQRHKKRHQMRRNLKDIKKFLRKTLSTLKRMKSLMMQQVELVRNMRSEATS